MDVDLKLRMLLLHGLRLEALIKWEALDAVFGELDRAINQAGLISRAGQIIAAKLLAAPSQRNSDSEKAAIKTH